MAFKSSKVEKNASSEFKSSELAFINLSASFRVSEYSLFINER